MPRGVGLNWVYDEALLQGRLWSPNVLRPSLWFDAADLSTLTLVSGNASEWRDKSGNGRHVSQTTAASRPTYSGSGLNGRPTLDWGSAINTKGFQNLSVSNFNPTRYFIVADYDGSDPFNEFASLVSHNFISAFDLILTSNGGIIWFSSSPCFHNGSSTSTSVALPTINNPFVLTTNFGQTSNRTQLYVGNDRASPNRGWRGKISEIIAVDYVWSVADRQLLEGYGAWKWGIPLVATHPYVNRPPLIGD